MRLLEVIHNFDLWTFGRCSKCIQYQLFIRICRCISRSADGYFYIIAGVIFLFLEQWAQAKVLALGFVLERSFYFYLKNKLKRNRPQQTIPGFKSIIQPSDKFSFPSGHTSAAFLMLGLMSAFYPFLLAPLFIWSVLVGLSRVMLGVHFPTDIVAGAIMGYSLSQLCLSIIL